MKAKIIKLACACAVVAALGSFLSAMVTQPPPKAGDIYVVGKKPDPWCINRRVRVVAVQGGMVKYIFIGSKPEHLATESVDRFSCSGITCVGRLYEKDTFNCVDTEGAKP